MKHQITDDVNVNVKVDIPSQDLEDLIDAAVNGVVKVLVVWTASKIVLSLFKAS